MLFYSSGKTIFLPILLASIAANFRSGIAIDNAEGLRRPRLFAYGVTGNLLVLGVFKYTGFAIENFNALLGLIGISLPVPQIGLPLGISFYTFHAISYIADVAKRRVAANRRFDEFMLYMSMFPQLVAGPIVRYSTVARQLHDRRHTIGRFSAGMRIFIIGLAWKVLIADQIAPVADGVFDYARRARLRSKRGSALYAYGMQIYFDFGGYSAMAVGLGVMIGFTLPRNFRVPYASLSITDFWRRWHMSLSAWLRDYVYIPLGGNRISPARTYANLWTVFLLCGLWHGASWTFVIWGAYHGLSPGARARWSAPRALRTAASDRSWLYSAGRFLGWVWFRANSFDPAAGDVQGTRRSCAVRARCQCRCMCRLRPLPARVGCRGAAGAMAVAVAAAAARQRRWERSGRSATTPALLALLAVIIVVAASSTYNPFLYNRF